MNEFTCGEEYNNNKITNHNKYLYINNYTPSNKNICKIFTDGCDQFFPEEANCGETISKHLKVDNIRLSHTGDYQSFPEDEICCDR